MGERDGGLELVMLEYGLRENEAVEECGADVVRPLWEL